MIRVMGNRVRITEVAARDGLQNESAIVPTSLKAELVRRLALMRPDEIEVTSFVSPKWIPQLGDAELLLASLPPLSCEVSALVPNEQGMRRLLDVNEQVRVRVGSPIITKASVFAAASEGFSRKNTNASVAEVIEKFKPVISLARENGLNTRGYISCIVRCPVDGDVMPSQVADVARRLLDIGVEEIDLGDTVGAATPESIGEVIGAVRKVFDTTSLSRHGENWKKLDAPPITVHLHDTFGRARDCVIEALRLGVRSFDSSVAGLGGCPFAGSSFGRAPGNISTESLVEAISAAGFECHIDPKELTRAAQFARSLVSGATSA